MSNKVRASLPNHPIKPRHDYVLCRNPIEKVGSIHVPESAVRGYGEQNGLLVIAVGPKVKGVSPGDWVLVCARELAPTPDEREVLVKDEYVIAVLDKNAPARPVIQKPGRQTVMPS